MLTCIILNHTVYQQKQRTEKTGFPPRPAPDHTDAAGSPGHEGFKMEHLQYVNKIQPAQK